MEILWSVMQYLLFYSQPKRCNNSCFKLVLKVFVIPVARLCSVFLAGTLQQSEKQLCFREHSESSPYFFNWIPEYLDLVF